MIQYDTRYFDNNLNVKNNNSMDFLGIGQAIGGIAGAIGTYAASKENRKAQEATNAANLALARQQNDWNIQQWEREMAYNSPANKLKLLEDAGLNPVWFGANLGPTETQAPKSADLANQVAPQLDAGAIGSSLGNLTSSLIAAGNYHLTKKAQDLEERKIEIDERRLGIESARTEQDIEESKQRINESKKVVERITQEIENLKKQGKLTDEQAKVAAKQVELMEQERLRCQEEMKGLQLDNKQKEMYLEKYAEFLEAELNVKKATAKELAAAAYNYITSAYRAEAEKYGIELENKLTEEYGALDRIGGIVSKGVSIITSIAGAVGKGVRLIKGVKSAKKAADAADKLNDAKVDEHNAKADYYRNKGVNPPMRGRR